MQDYVAAYVRRQDTVISGRLPAGNVLIFPQKVVGAGYRKVHAGNVINFKSSV